MKYYSDYSDLQEALAKVDKFGAVTFNSAKTGNMIFEESQVEMYNKIQRLLNCDAMESAHGYLYNLDPEELTEAEASKVNNLWKLGCEKGFIEDFTEDEEAEDKKDVEECDAVQAQASNLTPATPAQQQVAANALQAMRKQDAFTILYSAMRDGSVKTGEAYSNAINPRSAKMDVISQLERAGYSNISILAIECGDPDCCGADCANTYVKQADMTPVATQSVAEIPDYAEEADVNEAIDNKTITVDSEVIEDVDKYCEEMTKKYKGLTFTTKYPKEGYNGGIPEIVASGKEALLKKWYIADYCGADNEKDALNGMHWKDIFDESELSEADVNEADKADDAEKADDKEADKEDADKKEDAEADKKEDKKSEKAEEPDEKLKDDADAEKKAADAEDDDKLDAAEKTALKDSYKKAFKAAMLKCKFEDRAFDDLSLDEKVTFFTELSKAWNKADPSKFMDDKELSQLEKITVKK